MQFRESETIELKRMYVDDIRKEIIAMANSLGGTIYVGIDDQGVALGVDDPDDVITRISNGARDAIKPDITMFLRYETIDIEGKAIVCVRV